LNSKRARSTFHSHWADLFDLVRTRIDNRSVDMRLASRTVPGVRRRSRPGTGFNVENLESRQLLSTANLVATPSLNGSVSPDAGQTPAPTPYGPYQIRNAYGVNQIPALTSPSGTVVSTDGTGQTITIVDAYNAPTIQTDVDAFDQKFSVSSSTVSGTNSLYAQYGPASSFLTVVGQSASSPLPADNSSWAIEASLDVEWAHAIAPGAKIALVEANSASYSDLTTAVQYASTLGNVVSMSWGGGEFSGEQAYDKSTFSTPGVVYVAASGDSGVLEWPSSSVNVVAVGGTTLTANLTTGAYSGETAWSGRTTGSGGGVSRYEPLPSYQSNAFGRYASGRTTPDVAYDANLSTGVAVVSGGAWYVVGGTSVGAPQWSAIFALADQARAVINAAPPQPFSSWPPLDSTTVPKALYDLAYTEYQSAPSTVYHDVTSGYNARYNAGRGFDLVTGFGSPQANNLVQYLTTWSLPSGSPSAPFTSASPAVQGGAAAPASVGAPAASAIVIAVPPVATGGMQAVPAGGPQVVLAGVPAAASSLSAPTLVASATSGTGAGFQVPAVVAARPAQPLLLAPTSLLDGPLAFPGDRVAEPLPATAPDRFVPLEIEPIPSWVVPGVDNAAVPLGRGGSPNDAVIALLAGDAPGRPDLYPSKVLCAQPAPVVESSLAAGAALVLWGAWEVQVRRPDRKRQRGFFKRPECF
jgi:hypothetical protein